MNFRVAGTVIALALGLGPAASADPGDPVLTARPGLCILKDPDTQECRMGVILNWRAMPNNYCLHHSQDPEPLACWTQADAGEHRQALESEEDVSYWLRRNREPEQLAEIEVRVLSLAQRRPERRRRRHAWTAL